MDKNQLASALRTHFPAAPTPPADELVTDTSGEAVEIKKAFLRQIWTDVPKETLAYHHSAIAYFTDRAFRYYLPAFLTLMLEDMDAADMLTTSLIRHLTLPTQVETMRLVRFTNQSGLNSKGIQEFLLQELKESTRNVHLFISRMHLLNKEQGSCVHTFLRVMNDEHPEYYAESEPLTAVERYWFQYPALA